MVCERRGFLFRATRDRAKAMVRYRLGFDASALDPTTFDVSVCLRQSHRSMEFCESHFEHNLYSILLWQSRKEGKMYH